MNISIFSLGILALVAIQSAGFLDYRQSTHKLFNRLSSFALSSSSLSLATSSTNFFHHEIIHQSTKSNARVCRIHTPHGIIDTPGFVAVATNAALKGLSMADADKAGQQLIFCNSYHLMLQPGTEVIDRAGGLHKFMHRPKGPIITDSGGFQIFSLKHGSVHSDVGEINSKHPSEKTSSLSELKRFKPKYINEESSVLKIDEEGVLFRSYHNGKTFMLTPESTIKAQKKYKSDIIIPLDELPSFNINNEQLLKSVELSHRWEIRSLKEHLLNINHQAIYAVIHGGINQQMRLKSIEFLTSKQFEFNGYAIGGSLGSCHEELVDTLKFILPKLPKNKPNHLLGIADEMSILATVPLGVDTFDSSFPTKLARHGTLFTQLGKIHVSNAKYANAFQKPICNQCECHTCINYDLAYLHHLKKANEPLLWQLASIHNIYYMNNLMRNIRSKILNNEI